MPIDPATDLIREAFMLSLMVSAPILIAALVIGLIISVAQAVTQVQEQTLSFVPKILGMGAVAIVVIPWITMKVMEFSARMFAGY